MDKGLHNLNFKQNLRQKKSLAFFLICMKISKGFPIDLAIDNSGNKYSLYSKFPTRDFNKGSSFNLLHIGLL